MANDKDDKDEGRDVKVQHPTHHGESFTKKNAATSGRYYITRGQVTTSLPVTFSDRHHAQRVYRHSGFSNMEWVIIVNEDGEQEPVQIIGWDTDAHPAMAITVSDTGVTRCVYPEEMVKID